jgi:hypothetical protein
LPSNKDELSKYTAQTRIHLPDASYEKSLEVVKALICRHEALRSRIEIEGAVVYQVVLGPDDLKLKTRWVKGTFPRQIDPTSRSSYISIERDSRNGTFIDVVIHHIFCDAFGLSALILDAHKIFSEGADSLTEPRQPRHYALKEVKEKEVASQKHWEILLEGAPRACTYRPGRVYTSEEYKKDQVISFGIPEHVLNLVQGLATRVGCTPTAVWLAATSSLVGRFASQYDQVVWLPVANRFTTEDLRAVANLSSAAFPRIKFDPDEPFSNLIRKSFTQIMNSLVHGSYNATSVYKRLTEDRIRGMSFRPTYAFNFVPPYAFNFIPPIGISALDDDPRPSLDDAPVFLDETRNNDLEVCVMDKGRFGEISVRVGFQSFGQYSIKKFCHHLIDTIQNFCQYPDSPISEFRIPSLHAHDDLLYGHPCGTGVSMEITRGIVKEACADLNVQSVDVRVEDREGTLIVVAEIYSSNELGPSEIDRFWRACRAEGSDVSGAVIPDAVELLPARTDLV